MKKSLFLVKINLLIMTMLLLLGRNIYDESVQLINVLDYARFTEKV